MINQNRLHTCSSYSCLQSLNEKPSCRSFSFSAAESTACTTPMITAARSCLADDIEYYRPGSPTTVIIDDDGDELDNDATSMSSASSAMPSTEEPLNDEWHCCIKSSSCKICGRVKFNPKVAITFIPSHRDYSPQMKARLWTSPEQIHCNAVKNQMQRLLDDDDYMYE